MHQVISGEHELAMIGLPQVAKKIWFPLSSNEYDWGHIRKFSTVLLCQHHFLMHVSIYCSNTYKGKF